jgi:hypothetical protein
VNKSGERTKLRYSCSTVYPRFPEEASTRAANAGALVGMLGANIRDLKDDLEAMLDLGVIIKYALVPLADAEGRGRFRRFRGKPEWDYAS